MTRIERLKLAKAARGLAMDCVAGTAPGFDRCITFRTDGTPGCVLGHLFASVGISRASWLNRGGTGGVIGDATEAMVWVANDSSGPEERHGAVVFPLLWLADELESQP